MPPHSQNLLGIGSIDNCRRGYKVNTERPGKMKSANRELGVGDLIKKGTKRNDRDNAREQ